MPQQATGLRKSNFQSAVPALCRLRAPPGFAGEAVLPAQPILCLIPVSRLTRTVPVLKQPAYGNST